MRAQTPILRRILPWAVFLIALIGAFLFTVGVLGRKAEAEGLMLAEQSLRRAAVECYALEGTYPTDVEYLYERYGVAVDRSRYVVHYAYVASNLMPDIAVLPG